VRTRQPWPPTGSACSKSQRRQSTSKQQPPLPPPPIPPPATEALPLEENVASMEVARSAPTGRRRQSPTVGARGRQPSPSATGRGRQPSPMPAVGHQPLPPCKSAPAATSKHHLPMAAQTSAVVSRNPPHEGICADRVSCTSPPRCLSSPRRLASPKRTSPPRQRPISPVPAAITAPGMIAMGMAARGPLLAGRSPSPLPRAPSPMQQTPPFPNLNLNGFGPVPAWVGAPLVGSPRLLPKWTS